MKLSIADWIQSVIAAAKIEKVEKVSNLLDISDRIQEAKIKITDEYSKIVEANLEVKKDAQGTPILKDGVEIKFISNEWRKQLEVLDLDIQLSAPEKKLINECIGSVIGNIMGEEAQELLAVKRKLVDLSKSL